MFEVFRASGGQNVFQLAPAVMDFMRKVALFKGKVMFVEENRSDDEQCGNLAQVMLVCLAQVY